MRSIRLRHPKTPAPFIRKVTASLAGVLPAGTEAEVAADVGPKWVQVTREGNFPGYNGGQTPFRFTRADLQTMVNNIRTHPAYEVDAAGTPIGHVIPWDYNHASECDPTSGELPVAGAPAQAWTMDLEVRNAPDGSAQLWALTDFLEPARTYVRAGQYKWASVSVHFNSVDPESGQNVGAVISSIALTNTPFVEGMEKLVATKQQASRPNPDALTLYRRSFYDAAKTPQEAINCMKEMFGLLETASAPEVATQLGVVKSWFESGQAPVGTDPEYITGSLRTILNLPSLTPDLQVLEYAMTAVQQLMQTQSIQIGLPAALPAAEVATVPPVTMSKPQGDTAMSELLKSLAVKLGVIQSDAAVIAAMDDLLTLRQGVRETFSLMQDGLSAAVLLASVKQSKGATEKLKAIAAALGVENPDEAVARLAETIAQAGKLKELMPELDGLKAEKKKRDAESEEADVEEAIAASKLPSNLKPALLLHRRTNPEQFAKDYPKAAPGTQQTVTSPQQQTLLQRNVNQQGGLTVNADGTGITLGGATPPKVAGQSPYVPKEGTLNLGRFSGNNPTARAKAYLSTVVQGWDKMDNDTQFRTAVELKNSPGVHDQPVA